MVYTLKVTLDGVQPPIWRRLRVPGEITMGELHRALQIAMGWDDEHLHSFTVGKQTIGEPTDDGWDETRDEAKTLLANVARKGSRFTYTYDFGDSWEHEIVVEDVAEDDGGPLPSCVAGKRACPPEDCGGIPGYDELLHVLADPKHPEYEERREWLGEDFDPEAFASDAVNQHLASWGKDLRDKLRLRVLREAGRKRSRPRREKRRR